MKNSILKTSKERTRIKIVYNKINKKEVDSMGSKIADYVKNIFSNSDNGYEEKRKELEDFLNSSDSSGSTVPKKEELGEVPNYDRLDYDAKTDDELKNQAESSLNDYYNSGKNSIESEIENLEKQHNSNKEQAQKDYDTKTQSLLSEYEKAKESLSNDALKRGLARSSIAINNQSSLESKKADKATKLNNELVDSISNLDNEILALSSKREKALADFNIAYASKLTTTLNDLIKERDDKKSEVLKYNNSLKEKEYNQSIDKKVKEESLYSTTLSNKQKENALNEDSGTVDYKANYDKMREILIAMSKDDAKKAIKEDKIFQDNVNDYYYYRLYDEFCR